MIHLLRPKGVWTGRHFRHPSRLKKSVKVLGFRADGMALIDKFAFKNGIVDVGMNKLLDVNFRNQAQITAWYVGLVDNASWSAFNDADTMSSHGGWIENQDYDEAARVTWSPGAASSRTIVNSTPMDFTMNDTVTIKGLFITSVSTKGGTTGILWSTGAFGSVKNLDATDVLSTTYQLSG